MSQTKVNWMIFIHYDVITIHYYGTNGWPINYIPTQHFSWRVFRCVVHMVATLSSVWNVYERQFHCDIINCDKIYFRLLAGKTSCYCTTNGNEKFYFSGEHKQWWWFITIPASHDIATWDRYSGVSVLQRAPFALRDLVIYPLSHHIASAATGVSYSRPQLAGYKTYSPRKKCSYV